MRRSYELLIAEHLRKGGFITNIEDGISHMTEKGYSSCIYDKKQGYSFTLVTVVFSELIIIVFSIDNIDETVKLMVAHGIVS